MKTNRVTLVARAPHVLWFGVLAVCGYGACVSVGPSIRSPRPSVPAMDNSLPYEGHGAVTILNDGTLLIVLGGDEVVTYAVDKESEDTVTFTPRDVLAYQLDTMGLALVQHDNDVFLDKDGQELTRRGLSPRQVFKLSFPDPDQTKPTSSPWSIASFSGTLKLSLASSKSSALLSLVVSDSDATGRVFNLTAPVVTNGTSHPDDSLVLKGGDPIQDNSECSIGCTRGSASISCTRGCKCYCSASGEPVCSCVSASM